MRLRPFLAAALFAVELATLAYLFQIQLDFDCVDSDYYELCRGIRSGVVRGAILLASIVVYGLRKPHRIRGLFDLAAKINGSSIWFFIHLFAVGVLCLSAIKLSPEILAANFLFVFVLLLIGGILIFSGLVFWALPPGIWLNWFLEDKKLLSILLIVSVFLSDIAVLVKPVWTISGLNQITFLLVAHLLSFAGFDVTIVQEDFLIAVKEFGVTIAAQCSGVEGFALTSGLMGIYWVLAAEDLRIKRYWFVLYPLALLTSWLFNILRIALLIWIGSEISPELAINGFHSYAGWLGFMIVGSVILVLANETPWFHKSKPAHGWFKTFSDPIALQILPFAWFLLTGIIAAAFWADPSQAYPYRFIATASFLLPFAGQIKAFRFRVEVLAGFVGLGIAVMWLISAQEGSATAQTHFWITTRVLGTVLLVPLIEELFFRGYLLEKLIDKGAVRAVVAILISSILFGLLHDRLVLGTLAGIAFASVKLYTGRIEAAIIAHATANAVIAFMATITLNWSLI